MMLQAHESIKLTALLQRAPRHWTILTVAVLLLAAAPMGIYILADKSHGATVFGNSQSYTAEVVSSQADGQCGNRDQNTGYWVDVTWTDGNSSHQGGYLSCGASPVIGSHVTIWVTDGGGITASSPMGKMIALIVVGVVMALTMGMAYGFTFRSLHKSREQLQAVVNGRLSSAIPVEVAFNNKSMMELRSLPSASASLIDREVVHPLLYSDNGSVPVIRMPKKRAGQWSLYLTEPIAGSKKQIGLLQRNNERCWIQLSPQLGWPPEAEPLDRTGSTGFH